MRIILLVIHFPLDIENIKGGVHSAVSNLLTGFKNLNIRVRVISFNKEIKEEKHFTLTENIDIIYCPEGSYPFHSMNYLLKCAFQVKKHIKKFNPDLVHYEAGDTFLFTKLFGLHQKKHLQTIHGISVAEGKINRNFKIKVTSYFNGLVEKIMLPRNVIHLSQYSKRMYEKKKLQHYTIIPNAVTEGYFELPVKSNTCNRLLYIGVIDRNKNILFLLRGLDEMIKSGKVFHLDILGGFKDQIFKQEVLRFINDNKLTEHLTFHGWVPQSSVMAIVANADILVVSSMQESLPMVIAECMAAGKVVIASGVGGVPEMIRHGETGYVINNADLKSLVCVLDDLHNNALKVRQLSLKAKAQAEKYHCENVAKKTIAFYNLICGNILSEHNENPGESLKAVRQHKKNGTIF